MRPETICAMDIVARFGAIQQARIEREAELYAAQTAMPRLLSADATYAALRHAVDQLSRSAPNDHDVLIQAFGISTIEVRYIEPHTFLFSGYDRDGRETFVACHFSQLIAHVSYIPKRSKERVITGFAHEQSG
jgi:hypothetical protein